VIAFPECFKEAVVKMAHETYNGWYNIPGVA
jgi:hypothetical protein